MSGKQGDYQLAFVFFAAGKRSGCPYRRAGGYTHKQTLLAGEGAPCHKGIVVFNGYYFVVYFGIQRIRHEARADALYFVRSGNTL